MTEGREGIFRQADAVTNLGASAPQPICRGLRARANQVPWRNHAQNSGFLHPARAGALAVSGEGEANCLQFAYTKSPLFTAFWRTFEHWRPLGFFGAITLCLSAI